MKFLTEADPELRGVLRTDPIGPPSQQEIFTFLDTLRDTGKTNMAGAAPYIEFYFDVPENDAQDYLSNWIKWHFDQYLLEQVLLGNTANQ